MLFLEISQIKHRPAPEVLKTKNEVMKYKECIEDLLEKGYAVRANN